MQEFLYHYSKKDLNKDFSQLNTVKLSKNISLSINQFTKDQGSISFVIDKNFCDAEVLKLSKAIESSKNASLFGLEAAIAKCNSNKITIGRGYPGVVPIYYFESETDLIISNVISRIVRQTDIKLSINTNKQLEYLAGEFLSPSETLYQEIRRLPAGSIAEFDQNKLVKISHIQADDLKTEINKQTLEDLIFETTKQHQRDSSSHAFELSGGLDSSSVLGSYLSKSGAVAKSYSCVFPELECDEQKEINEFCQIFNHDNCQIKATKLTLPLLEQIIDQICYFPDYPNSLSSLSYLEQAKKDGKELIYTGFGGDHLFSKDQKKTTRLIKEKMTRLKNRIKGQEHWLPWLGENAREEFFKLKEKHINQNFLKKINSSAIQNLSTCDTAEYLESAYQIAKLYNVKRTHPFLNRELINFCLLYTSPSPRDKRQSRMPSSA